MITIKDKSLADYVIHEDHQGFKIMQGESKTVLNRSSDLNSALRYIADCRLKNEGKEGMSLREYTSLKNNIVKEIMDAQKEIEEKQVNIPAVSPMLVDAQEG